MVSAKRGLGRGLDALLQSYESEEVTFEAVLVSVQDIQANPHQPRRTFTEQSLHELADSIAGSGVLQPILLRAAKNGDRPYELVAGERRWRASQLAGLEQIPAIIRSMDDEESLSIALIENLQREDLNAIEEARALKELQDQLDMTQEELAAKVSKSRSAIANAIRLLQLPGSIQKAVADEKITAGHGRSLLGINDPTVQELLGKKIIQNKLSVREAEAAVTYWKRTGTLPKPGQSLEETSSGTGVREQAACKPSKQLEKNPAIQEIEDKINLYTGLHTELKGHADQGRVVLHYKNAQDLENLLSLLGVDHLNLPQTPDEEGPEVSGIAEMVKQG